jgi:hypothetical protein
MKMKKFFLTMFILAIAGMQLNCNAQTSQVQMISEEGKASQVGVYYFHFDRRCNTCISVENNSKKAVEELYPEQVKSGEYFFKAVNLDEESGKKTGEELGIGMQALVVVHDEKKIDITGEGFMYVDNYDRLKSEVKKAVEKSLKE